MTFHHKNDEKKSFSLTYSKVCVAEDDPVLDAKEFTPKECLILKEKPSQRELPST
jgi:hypothetical protein